MNITFVLPPARHIDFSDFCPLGVGIIASRLINLNHTVSIVDAGARGHKEYWRILGEVRGDIIGIGGTIVQLRSMVESSHIIRKNNPNAFVFFAGRGVFSIESNVLLRYADAILMGEGEYAVPRLLEQWPPNGNDSFPPGWIWKDGNGELQSSGASPMVDVTNLPFPAWDLYPLDNYLQYTRSLRGYPVMHIISSRGCVHHCTFCDYESGRGHVRKRPVDHVVAEMQELSERYSRFKLKDFYFFDPSFMNSREWSKQLYKKLSDIGKFQWGCLARVDEVDRNLLALARESGCRYINFGVEAASDRVLNLVAKGTTVRQVKEAFQLCHEAGIRPGAFLLVGLPQETPADVVAMKTLLKDIRPAFISVSIAAPFPGTAIAQQYKDNILPVGALEFADYFPERTLFKRLCADPAVTQNEITAFYKECVDAGGYVNPVTFSGK